MTYQRKLSRTAAISLLLIGVGGIILPLLFRWLSAGAPRTSQMLYQQGSDLFAFSVDTLTSRKIAEGRDAWSWSPDGTKLILTDSDRASIWVSQANGSSPQLVLDNKQYPNLALRIMRWLTNEVVLLVFSPIDRYTFFLYSLNISTGHLQQIEEISGLDLYPAPNGKFWVRTYIDGAEISTLSGQRVLEERIPIFSLAFSPDSQQIAYLSNNRQIWIANISENGITDAYPLYSPHENGFDFDPDLRWSPDGKYVGYRAYKGEPYFQAVEVSTRKLKYSWPVPSVSRFFMWAPGSDAIIMKDRYQTPMLDLATGKITPILITPEDKPSVYITDWRFFPKPSK